MTQVDSNEIAYLRHMKKPEVKYAANPSYWFHDCELSPGGVFGIEDGKEVPIAYFYEVETIGTLNDNVLPSIQKIVTDSLLGIYFETKCHNFTDRHLISNHVNVAGISDSPDDRVLESVAQGNQCNVVKGGLTLYMYDIDEEEIDISLDAILSFIDSGEIEGRLEGIQRVSSYDYAGPSISTQRNNDPSDDLPKNSSTSKLTSTSLIALSGAAFLLMCFVFLGKRRNAKDSRDSEDSDDSFVSVQIGDLH